MWCHNIRFLLLLPYSGSRKIIKCVLLTYLIHLLQARNVKALGCHHSLGLERAAVSCLFCFRHRGMAFNSDTLDSLGAHQCGVHSTPLPRANAVHQDWHIAFNTCTMIYEWEFVLPLLPRPSPALPIGGEGGKMERFHHSYRIQTLLVNFICEPTQVIESPNEALFLGRSIRVFL